jgi:hypothetical protein
MTLRNEVAHYDKMAAKRHEAILVNCVGSPVTASVNNWGQDRPPVDGRIVHISNTGRGLWFTVEPDDDLIVTFRTRACCIKLH